MKITAPLEPVNAADSETLQWHGQIVTRKDRLAGLASTNCMAATFMRFARAPWVAAWGENLVIGDLRYDREARPGFAEIELGKRQPCPSNVPPWTPPRLDLLN